MAFGGENAESYYDEGLTAVMRGDIDAAVRFFIRAVELDRTSVAAYHQLGRCYLRMGQPERAVDILKKVVGQKPGFVPARLDLGHALLQAGHAKEARTTFADVLDQHPENGRAHLGMAQVHFAEQDWERAVAAAQAARMYGGATFVVLFLLGRAAKHAGNSGLASDSLKEADAIIQKSAEIDPDSPESHYLRGEVCLAQEQYSAAIDHYRAAEDRADDKKHYSAFGENFRRIDIMARRGQCLQRLGGMDAAREIGKAIVALDSAHCIGQTLSQL